MISCDLFRNVFNLLLRRDSIKKHCGYLTLKFNPYMTDDPFQVTDLICTLHSDNFVGHKQQYFL